MNHLVNWLLYERANARCLLGWLPGGAVNANARIFFSEHIVKM
jgi:hypothetical protein